MMNWISAEADETWSGNSRIFAMWKKVQIVNLRLKRSLWDDTCWEGFICVCANNLWAVCWHIALRASRVRIMTRGPFPTPPSLLPLHFLSALTCPIVIKVKIATTKKDLICKYSKYLGQLISWSTPSRERVVHIHMSSIFLFDLILSTQNAVSCMRHYKRQATQAQRALMLNEILNSILNIYSQ